MIADLYAPISDEERQAAHQYAAFAEREAAKIPGLSSDTPIRDISSAAVIGAGTMGGGIAMALANAGITTKLIDISEEAAARGMEVIARNYGHTVKRGKLDQADMDRRLALITGSGDLADVAQADLVIEAATEDMQLKKELFRKIDGFARGGALLATNTSSLDIDEIAGVTSRPADVIGAHFFSPAHVMRLLEVVRAAKTSDEVVASLMTLGKRLRKVSVLAKVYPGFIGNAMLFHYMREAYFLIEEGVKPRQLDAALTRFGYAMGFCTLGDMSGNDVGIVEARKAMAERDPLQRYPDLRIEMCDRGRLGQKVGLGWYRYAEGDRTPLDDPELDQIVADYANRKGIRQREIEDGEIIERCLFGMINEAARLLEQGIALRPSDIDAVYVTGYGFPAWRGGPLYTADRIGLDYILERVLHYNKSLAPYWQPAPLLDQLVANGKNFGSLQIR